jgi:arginase family enzyme
MVSPSSAGGLYGKAMSAEWPSIADLVVTEGEAPVALLGAPMEAGSVTPGRCDLAPAAVRQAMKRFSTYDLTHQREVSAPIRDLGDVPVTGIMPAAGFAPIRDAVADAVAEHDLTILLAAITPSPAPPRTVWGCRSTRSA